MKTTLDLPSDVAATLRRESARRGGRSKAPMRALIAEAVRKTYGRKGSPTAARITARPGHGLVALPRSVTITNEEVKAALNDMS